MPEKLFNCTFAGETLPGQEVQDVKDRLAAALKLDTNRIDRLFSGKPVVIKREASQEMAAKYRKAFQKAGAVLRIEPASPSADPAAPKSASVRMASGPAKTQTVVCPKCGLQQPPSNECARCGVIISKFFDIERRREEALKVIEEFREDFGKEGFHCHPDITEDSLNYMAKFFAQRPSVSEAPLIWFAQGLSSYCLVTHVQVHGHEATCSLKDINSISVRSAEVLGSDIPVLFINEAYFGPMHGSETERTRFIELIVELRARCTEASPLHVVSDDWELHYRIAGETDDVSSGSNVKEEETEQARPDLSGAHGPESMEAGGIGATRSRTEQSRMPSQTGFKESQTVQRTLAGGTTDDDDRDEKPSGHRRLLGHLIGFVVGTTVGIWFLRTMADLSVRHHSDFYDGLGLIGCMFILFNLWLGIQDFFAYGWAGRMWRWILALDASLVISVLCGNIVMSLGFSQTTANVVGVLFGLAAMSSLSLALKRHEPFMPGSKTGEEPSKKKDGS